MVGDGLGSDVGINPELVYLYTKAAKKDSWFSHIAIEVPGEETRNEWLEQVTDKEYDTLEVK